MEVGCGRQGPLEDEGEEWKILREQQAVLRKKAMELQAKNNNM